MFALANALREHTAMQEFTWNDHYSLLQATHITFLDPVLLALSACPHFQRVFIMTTHASANAMKKLLQLQPAAELRLAMGKEHWLAVVDEIRQGRCNLRKLYLTMTHKAVSDAMEAVKAVASAIRLNRNLEHLHLQTMQNRFTDEACVALAEAMTVNTTLRKISLSATVHDFHDLHNKATLGAQSYEAFAAMLRVNRNLVLNLPRLDTAFSNRRLLEYHHQMIIEQRLNRVGRGRLLAPSNHARREEWVDALHI
jgi:hypothetical protein